MPRALITLSMSAANGILYSATCIAIGEGDNRRAVLIEGQPGSGKSSLALALIDRGAVLIGDDGVRLTPYDNPPSGGDMQDGYLWADPPPNISGLLEIRNIGLVQYPTTSASLALIIRLASDAPRLPEAAAQMQIAGRSIPAITLYPLASVLHLRAEQALGRFGLPAQNARPGP